ncbi:MAG: GNAT family N-acetyltransferase [Dehalococcoidia bacterium]|nr:MAG: GNAT family N-acetyltransferase [Dehalococcoidia bacterium]
MGYTITEESFASLNSYWTDSRHNLNWGSIFVFPGWLQVSWQVFGSGAELYLGVVRQREKIIGIAPLLVKEETASIIGSADVCDYLDFIVAPGMGRDFFSVLLDDLRQKGINHLDLRRLRPDSTVLTDLVAIAKERRYDIRYQLVDVSLELELPSTWDEYLAKLTGKQRREVRRKLRRLWEAGNVDYHIVEDSAAVHDAMDTFLKLFSESREDKATFMTAQMESFFRSLADTMAEAGLLRLGILELDTLPTAIVMCFDYNDCVYLYNSGYNPRYSALSVGLLCKVLCIKDSIQRGRKRFDFLKGGEPYKYHLGGREIPLYSCHIIIK